MSIPLPDAATADDVELATLPNGLRVAAIRWPWARTLSLSVFIRTGSLHEPPGLSGISHVVEHMAFKGTEGRSCQRINLDAERLGAEVNAHTDKDHTAFHIDGLPEHLESFVELLADIVRHSTFPADELERERQVILQELTEVEEDTAAIAFQLLDHACWGNHPAANPVIGSRAHIRRVGRDDLLAYVRRQYTAANVVVAAAGAVDAQRLVAAVARAFGDMPAGTPHTVPAPAWLGGIRLRRLQGTAQCQTVLGFAMPALCDEAHLPFVLAAALLGEGMSSPLLDELRERRGLAYHAACSADLLPMAGQFVVEAVTAPAQAEPVLVEVDRLLREQALAPDADGVERARRQLGVRALRALHQPGRRVEAAALDLFTFGRLRPTAEWLQRLQAVSVAQVRDALASLRLQPVAVALAGNVPQRARDRAQALFGGAPAARAGRVPRRWRAGAAADQ